MIIEKLEKYLFIFSLFIFSTQISCNTIDRSNTSGDDLSSSSDLVFTIDTSLLDQCIVCKDVIGYRSKDNEKKLTCFVNDAFAIVIEDRTELGVNFMVFETSGPRPNELNLDLKDTLYVIDNEVYGYTWFLGLYDHYLLIDEGSASQARGLFVYDLKNNTIVFEQETTSGDEVTFNGNVLSFWESSDVPRDSICPEEQEWEEWGGYTRVLRYIEYDIKNAKRVNTEVYKCTYEE